MHHGEPQYGEFTCTNASNYRSSLHEILFEAFYGSNSRNPNFFMQPSLTSLFNIFKHQKHDFVTKCFEKSYHLLVDVDDPGFFLFLFLENCFDVESVEYLLQLVASYYNTLHYNDSVKYKISHTKILQSNVVFLDSCHFIQCATSLMKNETYQNFMFQLDGNLKHPDQSASGVRNAAAFTVRIGFFSKPFFFFVVMAVIEFVGLYPSKPFDSIKYEGSDQQDPPSEYNALRFFTSCLQSTNTKGKDTFFKGIGLGFITCIANKNFPSTYSSFKEKGLHLQVQQWFQELFVHPASMNSFYGRLIKATKQESPLARASVANVRKTRRCVNKRKLPTTSKSKKTNEAVTYIEGNTPNNDHAEESNSNASGAVHDTDQLGGDDDPTSDEAILVTKKLKSSTVGTALVIVQLSWFKESQKKDKKDDITFCDTCINRSTGNIGCTTFDQALVSICLANVKSTTGFCMFHASEWLVRYQGEPDNYQVQFGCVELQQRLERMALSYSEQSDVLKSFVYISSNIIPQKHKKKFQQTLSQYEKCECYNTIDFDSPDKCLTNDSCQLRDARIECSFICNSGECGNQRIRKLRNNFDRSSLSIKAVKDIGYGLFTNGVSFKKGDLIMEYVGEVIDQQQHKKILNNKAKLDSRLRKNYIMHSGMHCYYINAERKGNYSRFINHSCEPNCVADKWTVRVVCSFSIRCKILQFVLFHHCFSFFSCLG